MTSIACAVIPEVYFIIIAFITKPAFVVHIHDVKLSFIDHHRPPVCSWVRSQNALFEASFIIFLCIQSRSPPRTHPSTHSQELELFVMAKLNSSKIQRALK